MVLKKTGLIFLIIMIISLSIAFANPTWYNFGNMGTTTGGNELFFGSLIPSNHNSSNPLSCTIGQITDYAPLIVDLNLDGKNNIVIGTTSNKIKVYSFDCQLLYEFGTGESLTSMPTITNYDSDEYQEITFQTENYIQIWEYDTTNQNLTQRELITNDVTAGTEFGFNCGTFQSDNYCLSIDDTRNDYILYDMTKSSPDFGTSTYVSNFYGGGIDVANNHFFGGFGSVQTFKDIGFNVPVTTFGATKVTGIVLNPAQDYQCDIINPSSTYIESNSKINTGVAGLGLSKTPNNFFSSGILKAPTTPEPYYAICDLNGDLKIYNKWSSGINSVSNWVITDMNGDSGKEACILYYNNTISSSQIRCYDYKYDLVFLQNITTTRPYNNFAIGDFKPSNEYMEFVTVDGIYEYDSASSTLKILNNFTEQVSSNASIIIGVSDLSYSNFAILTGNNNILVSGFGSQTNVSCGDGICSLTETIYTCFADCYDVNNTNGKLQTNEQCEIDSDCITGKCLYSVCTLKDSGESCILNSECLSENCLNSKCTKPSYWQTVNSMKDGLFGDDDITNIFISFLLTFGTAIGVVVTLRSIMAVILGITIVFGGIIFFTVVGWLPPWILIGFIFMASVFAVVVMILKGGGN